MVFLYVQTWVIASGKTREHEDIWVKLSQYMEAMTKPGKAPKDARVKWEYCSQRYGPMGARVLIMELEDQTHYQKFWEFLNNDKGFIEIRDKWRELIDPNTWKAVFWDKIMPE